MDLWPVRYRLNRARFKNRKAFFKKFTLKGLFMEKKLPELSVLTAVRLKVQQIQLVGALV